MKEDFLHFVWKEQLFDKSNLLTEDGQPIIIIDKGQYNFDAGPDFFNCKISLDNIIWAGNIEIHLRSSDWYRHQHQEDYNYDNIILHVVLENDLGVHRKNGSLIPTISLKNRFYNESSIRYDRFFKTNSMVYPCMPHLASISEDILLAAFETALYERLNTKAALIQEQLQQTNNNWEESFYHLLGKSFGFKVNAVPLQLLTETIPLSILERESNELIKIESLLFGVAGLLNSYSNSSYQKKLNKEFKHQEKKYNLQSLHPAIWKFGKLRPSNFPTIRIAQLAMLIFKQKRLFKKCITSNSIESLRKLFTTEASGFWITHFHFESRSEPITKQLGNDSINSIIINTVIPFCYAYGKHIGNTTIKNKAIEWLTQLPAEKNKYVKNWSYPIFKFSNALQTQGLIQLNNSYCAKNRCIHCKIGCNILNIQK